MYSNNGLLEKLLSIEDVTEVTVRFSHTDAAGIVHFRNYLIISLT